MLWCYYTVTIIGRDMTKKNYTIIQSHQQYLALLKHIEESDYLAFDTETTGLNPRKSKVIGLSLSGKIGTAFYLPRLSWYEGALHQQCEDDYFVEVLKLLTKKDLLTWNGSFDVRMVKSNFDIDLTDSLIADIQMMKHTLDEEPPFALKEVAVLVQDKIGFNVEELANQEQIELKENVTKNGGSTTKDNYEMYKADLDVLGKYACSDADLTLRLAEYYKQKLEQEDLWDFFFEEEVMPLYREVTIPMESYGVRLDMDFIHDNYKKLKDKITYYESKVKESLCDTDAFKRWLKDRLDDKCPISTKGNFAQKVVERFNIPLPKTSVGKYSVTKKLLLPYAETNEGAAFLLGLCRLKPYDVEAIQREMLVQKDGDIINISSKDHLSSLCFNYMGLKASSKTKSGKDQFDQDYVQGLSDKHEWANYLNVYNKLSKIKSSYYDRILEGHDDGYYYFGYKQHGTVSGRYSSDAQQMPRPITIEECDNEDIVYFTNTIRAFFIVDEGRVFIDCDYESLEPHCVSKHSKVQTYNGIQEIKDVSIGDMILTCDGFRKVTNKWRSSKPTVEVVTRKGTVRCSPDHKIYVVDKGWTRSEDLRVGDVLQEEKFDYEGCRNTELPVYLKGASIPFSKIELTSDLFWALGAFLGDGVFCTTSSKYVGICGLVQDGITPRFRDILTNIGAVPKRYDDFRTPGMESYRCHDSWLVDIFKKTFELADDNGKILHIPSFVLNASENNRLSFLAGIVDTDGTFNSKKKELSISTKNAKLASDICSLGNTLGLDGRIGLATKGGCKMYQIRFTSVSINKLINYNFASYLTCDRKRFVDIAFIGKIASPPAEILQINLLDISEMIDISVEGNHEFVCDNIRVHNCFAHVSTDERLRDIFRKGHDFYSTIAIFTEGLHGYSADKKAENYLGKLNKPKRQSAKAFALGIPYGMSGYALAMSLGVSKEEGYRLVKGYLSGFPDLAQWMESSEEMAKNLGYVVTLTGRVRHLPKVKELYKRFGDKLMDFKFRKKLESSYGSDQVKNWYMDYKNGLNNAKNVQIQGLSASIVNRAAIAVTRAFKKHGIDGRVGAQVHDQLIYDVLESQKEEAANIVKECMENTTKLSIQLKAPPCFSYNWRDGH